MFALRSALIFAWFVLMVALAGEARAACSAWNANLSVSLTSGHESEQLTLSWNTVSNCTTFTFHHYLVCQRDGAAGSGLSAPGSPSVGTCTNVSNSIGTSTKTLVVNRSYHEFATTIFACQSSIGCTAYYGDGTHGATVTNQSVTGTTTQKERWLLKDMVNYTDSTRAVYGAVAGPAAVFYPSGWTDAGKLGLWYTVTESGTSYIKYQRTSAAGWDDFVTASWTTPVTVAQGSDGSSSAYYHITNPWVVPAEEGSTKYIRMFLQTGASGGSFTVKSLDSTDQDGAAFGLTCSSSPCSVTVFGETGTCPNGALCNYDAATTHYDLCANQSSSGCAYLDHAAHGRIGWNSVDDGPVDFTSSDAPFMLFTGRGTLTTCSTNPDDVYTALWLPVSGDWDVAYTSGTPHCPVEEFTDGHDPYILPLADGTFKGYYNRSPEDGNAAVVCYSSDGSAGSWEDCVEIEMGFDDATPWDGSPADPHACVGDTEMFAYVDGSAVRHEGGFTVPQGSPCFSDATGFIFIEHKN